MRVRQVVVWPHVTADGSRYVAGITGTEFLRFAGDPFGHRLTEHHGGRGLQKSSNSLIL